MTRPKICFSMKALVMKFVNLALIVFLAAQLLTACATHSTMYQKAPHQNGPNETEIIYKSNYGSRIDVFNIEKLWSSQEGIGYLDRRDFKYSEFGGRMRFCSSVDYYCVIGGIAAAVPKKINGQKKWRVEEWECESQTVLSAQSQTTITCTFKGQSTRFTYSPSRGIISYTNLSRPNIKLELIGDKGLLAAPSTTEDTDNIDVSVAEPLELEITTDKLTQEEIVAEHGQPDRKVFLDDKASLCKQRWYYDGQADLGFGMVDVAMYVDFDENGGICKRKN